eukprot:TRINITY_DN3334_c0_g1_i1.p1 TRINITY_DN3334_c0_g1~~TRINITY_DN3334_c0_g1_i1.p1  ORF type:complete len:406 (-),score=136.88 TRINITY_DN3334_c0_g1_i1:69-1286(-)
MAAERGSFLPGMPGTPSEAVIRVEIPLLTSTRKLRFDMEKTVHELLDLILKKNVFETTQNLAFFVQETGIWLQDTRKLGTYGIQEDDSLILQYKNVGQQHHVDVNHPLMEKRETIDIQNETTVRGILQSIILKRIQSADQWTLTCNGLNLLDHLNTTLFQLNIGDGAVLEFRDPLMIATPPASRPVPMGIPMGGSFMAELRSKQSSKPSSSFVSPTKAREIDRQDSEVTSELLEKLQKRRSDKLTASVPNPPIGAKHMSLGRGQPLPVMFPVGMTPPLKRTTRAPSMDKEEIPTSIERSQSMDGVLPKIIQVEKAREKETQLEKPLEDRQIVFPWAEWFEFQRDFPVESLVEVRDAIAMREISLRLDRILHRDGLEIALDVLPTEELSRLMQTLSVCLARSTMVM